MDSLNPLPFRYLSTAHGAPTPDGFHSDYHVHILVSAGEMCFSDGRNNYRSGKDDLVIWQMSNNICHVSYSPDFQADYFLASPTFVGTNNPVMSWATMGFVFIRMNPSYHLAGDSLATIRHDFRELADRYACPDIMFKNDILGSLFRIFLYDLWGVYHDLRQSLPDDNAAQIFLRFAALVERDCKQNRKVAHYADLLCISPKYLNQICHKVTDITASEWIAYYTNYELVKLLNDPTKTILDIADELNFSSDSFFTRYTKKHIGATPTEYRRKRMRGIS